MSDVTTPETEVGSYFVANYPPFSVWTPDAVAAEGLPALHRAPVAGTPLGLYLHIPFCRKRCHFCYFRVYTGKNAEEVNTYLDLIAREWELYAALPAIAGRALDFVYFGGGTPSFLSTTQLGGLVSRLKAATPWDRAEEVTFECEPGTLTEAKLTGDPRHRRDASEPRRRALRRSHPRAERPRPPLGGDPPRLRLRPRPRLPADQHRPDRRHARRDRRQVDGGRRPRAGARAGQHHHLPDGAALQHHDQPRQAEAPRPVRGGGRRLGHQAALGRRGVLAPRARRLSRRQRLHGGEGSGQGPLRLSRSPLAGRRPRRPRRRLVRPRQRRPPAEPGFVGDLRRRHRGRRAAAGAGLPAQRRRAPDPRVRAAAQEGRGRALLLRRQVPASTSSIGSRRRSRRCSARATSPRSARTASR